MAKWSFLTNHAQALVCIARDPGVRLREIADVLGVTERRAFGIVNELTEAGYVVKDKDGRRNRYHINRARRKPVARICRVRGRGVLGTTKALRWRSQCLSVPARGLVGRGTARV